MSAPIHVRLAEPADFPALKAILAATFDSTWRPQLRPEATAAYLASGRGERYIDRVGLSCWLAERAGEVLGFVHWQDGFIEALHVLPNQARSGIGRQLLSLAEAELVRAGHREVRLETDTFNLPSRAFYEACGYREAGRYPDEEWDSDLTTVLFVKALG